MSRIDLMHENPDVYRLRVPLKRSTFDAVNCYIVVDGDDYLLVDPGELDERNGDLIVDALRELGLDLGALRIYLTHLHSDHSEMAGFLATADTPVYAGRADHEYFSLEEDPAVMRRIAQQLLDDGVPAEEEQMAMAIRSTRAYVPDPAHMNVVMMDDGFTLNVGNHEFRVIGVSGHTPLGMALYHPASGLLLAGDHVLYGITPVVDSTRMVRNGLSAYVESMDRLSGLPVNTLLPGHGEAGGDPVARMRQIAQRKLAQADAMRSCIAAHPGSTGYDAIQSVRWSAVKGAWADAPLDARAFIANDGCIALDFLVEQGMVERGRGEDGVYRYRVLEG